MSIQPILKGVVHPVLSPEAKDIIGYVGGIDSTKVIMIVNRKPGDQFMYKFGIYDSSEFENFIQENNLKILSDTYESVDTHQRKSKD
jgi:hypothetical protein